MTERTGPTRRTLLAAAGTIGLGVGTGGPPDRTARAATPADLSVPATAPFPPQCVRLLPSPWLAATRTNRRYLLSLDPDRLLSGFRTQAGLPARAPVYGGWEADTIAGHTLGHYLSALSHLHAGTGEPQAAARAAYITDELAACQNAQGNGFVGAFTRRTPQGAIEPGIHVFEEIRRGDIRARRFSLNGSWAPLYNWHKLLAGLLDADRLCATHGALGVACGLAGYIHDTFSHLDDARLQQVLSCEYGGLNESMAELYARTGDTRWLALAGQISDRATMDPLRDGRDELDGLHANTMIAKTVGAARVYEVSGDTRAATAARTLWQSVVSRRSYACGGTGDFEYFTTAGPHGAGDMGTHLNARTCETCATYNMLKLTRHVHAWQPHATQFDYYERAHLNHIMAQHDPHTGMFTYMLPMGTGAARDFSTPTEDFWCCVGTGMESHARHGDVIWWLRDGDEVVVNLFIPSELDWHERGVRMVMRTHYPLDGQVMVSIPHIATPMPLTLALRVPGWARGSTLSVNGEHMATDVEADGYVRIRRTWQAGDSVMLVLDMPLRRETVPAGGPAAPSAFFYGPLLLAADLGPARGEVPWRQPLPALVADDPTAMLEHVHHEQGVAFRAGRIGSGGGAWPGELVLRPFAFMQSRLAAPYLTCVPVAAWTPALRETLAGATRDTDRARIIDAIGPDRPHAMRGARPCTRLGRKGWMTRTTMSTTLHAGHQPMALRVLYYDDDVNRLFTVRVNGHVIATENLDGRNPGVFSWHRYAIPPDLPGGQATIEVSFASTGTGQVGQVFGVQTIMA
ncbi:glycoside hydrolase family 127 protein [Komagataeibacter sp. FNDCF1]|uniref:glycoside hydrolase family 127 protein n=1 Tax=Komagataeibacter sp. FNDCF1 TaxID=2878681 RepID=UPI001E296C00|nr:glycoside hydrolase family 127 protein [Komagataeibacter sp. FNDCF1]MCE2563323.1 glycoside hydrolase family 127 protein [Komagataeibacter sp. FNDCF1]